MSRGNKGITIAREILLIISFCVTIANIVLMIVQFALSIRNSRGCIRVKDRDLPF